VSGESLRASVCTIFRSSGAIRIAISEDAFDVDADYTNELATTLALHELDLYWTGTELVLRKRSNGAILLGGALDQLARTIGNTAAERKELMHLLTLRLLDRRQFNVRLHGQEKSWLLLTVSQGLLQVTGASTGSRTAFASSEGILDVFPRAMEMTLGNSRKTTGTRKDHGTP
jgi:hypothetical protein